MKDREGYPYLQGIDLMPYRDNESVEWRPTFTHIISRARQELKALGLSGRQRRKWRKAARRNLKAFVKAARPLDGLVNLNVGEQHAKAEEVLAQPDGEAATRAATHSAEPEGGGATQAGGRGGEATEG